MRSLNAALPFSVKRSGGSQIRSTWLSAEITSYFIFPSSVRACGKHDSPKAHARLIFPLNRIAGRADGAIAGQHAIVGCDRARFRPDLSGALCEFSARKGRGLRNQDRTAARRAGATARRARQKRHPAVAMLNQNKFAIALNLKHERGRELLFRMAERADVLLENFSPGTLDDLGVGWSVLRELNPRLVYATGTGFGISGPDRDNLAMDLTIQAASGIMSVTGAPDGPPMKAGPTLVDFMGGIHLYGAILTALFEREKSGEGRLVEVAMQEAVYPSLAASFEYYHRTGKPPPRTGNRQAGLSTAPYNVYPCADGHAAIHIVTEGHWRNLLKTMGREELTDDPRFRTNADRIAHMDETDALVSEWTRT